MVFYIIGVHAQTAGGVFEPGPPMQTSRIATAIGATASGEFLFFGGRSYGFVSSAFTDVFNPETMVFTNVNMLYPHDNAVVIKTEDGRFFIAGGGYNLGVPAYNTAEWYDPETRTFSDAGTMLYSRMQGTGIQLTDGRLLIVGGWYDPTAAVQTELYDPASGTSTAAGSLIQARSSALVLPCDDGGAVVFGGYPTYGGNYLAGVEYFDPVTNTFSVLQDELIADEPGYYTTYDNANKEEPSLYQLADGRYVFLAWRTDPVIEYILVSFDPATKVFERIHLNTPLKSDLTDGGFVEMTINIEEHLAYLLAADAEAAGAGHEQGRVGQGIAKRHLVDHRQHPAPGDRQVERVAGADEVAAFVDQPHGRGPHAPGGIGARPARGGDHHAGEIGRGALVAIGARVRDVVGNRGQPGGVRVQPGHARAERGGNRHGKRLSAASTPVGPTLRLRRLTPA